MVTYSSFIYRIFRQDPMCSPIMHMCQRCIILLRSSGLCFSSSTNVVWQHPISLNTTFSQHLRQVVPLRVTVTERTPEEKWKVCAERGLCTSGAPHGLPQAKDKRALVSYQPKTNATPSLSNIQTVLDLDAAPPLSPFEEISDEEALQIAVTKCLPPVTFSLRDYVDQSQTLTRLVHLGVNLWQLDQRRNVGSMLVRLDFQTDVVPRLLFLKDLGVEDSQLGPLLTKNPFLLTENLDNLSARVSYLKSKKFSSEAVASMVFKAPYLLNFSVKRLDNRLGFFQQQLGLNPSKTRDILTRLPRLLCGNLQPIKENLKVCELEFGFRQGEIQHIVTKVPKVLTANKKKLTQIFDYVHNVMGVPHSLIVKFPQVLNAQFLRVKERHLFLQYLGRAQYDPAHPSYISLDRFVFLPDQDFCTELALSTSRDFEQFQKTL